MNKAGTLIVGQGIAGTVMAFMLHKNNLAFTVIDPGIANTSSRIAAGMFTPVSGRRKTIQPVTLQQIPFAIKIYEQIQLLLGTVILHLQHVYQVCDSAEERRELVNKLVNAEFKKYIVTDPPLQPNIKQDTGAYEVILSGWLDCELMLDGFAHWLRQKKALLNEIFIYNDLQFGEAVMEYHGMRFNNIVFCEGYSAIDNPFFKNENIIPCKGDILTIRSDHLKTDRIIKKNGTYIISKDNNSFTAGSTYQWNNSTTEPDENSRKQIELKLEELLTGPYLTTSHKSAIRPTTRSRDVIAKQHPEHKGMFMLNGLGTKGVLQGPWWASQLVEILR
ncbi:MAG: FAD-binding oxidoreductase [Ferruginibacter sp.]